MSNENIFFTLEDLEDLKDNNLDTENNSVPCFCQGETVCVFCIKEKDFNKDTTIDFNYSLFENPEISQFQLNDYDEIFSKKVNYQVNFTVKQLSMICDYYGLLKEMKGKSKNKNDLIEALVSFENDTSNSIIVLQRKKLWFYLEELKKDSFLKKFLWVNF